jgi:competence protein ComEC
VVALALTSALAGTFSAPYGAYHFGHIQIYYVIANMLAVPLTAMWVMPAGLISILLMPVHLEALALVPMGWGIAAVTWIGGTVSSWPEAVLAVPHIPAWGLAALSLGLAWVGLWRTRIRYAGVVAVAVGLVSPLLSTPPDILVSAEARLIGVRTDDGVFVQKISGASAFTLDAWLQYWAAREASALPAQTDAISCDDGGCTLRKHDRTARILRGGETCDADIVISAEPLQSCPRDVLKIDRFSVWREGAYAVWLGTDGVRAVSDLSLRGDRPWVLGPPVRNAAPKGPALPQAQAEELPPE